MNARLTAARRAGLALVALAAGLAPAGAAWAMSDPAAWVRRIVVELDEINRKNGWRPEGEVRPGALASGAEARLEFPLAAGTTYRFVVICEAQCGAGEVELLDPAGARVGEPGVLVNMPSIEGIPAAPGTFTLRVAMTECAATTCVWSARLYAKG